MATATSTTTAIELDGGRLTALQREPIEAPKSDNESADPVLEASRLADSDVPEGGYGWVVVLSCAVLSWWTIGTSYAWGVIQGALVEAGLSSPATLSFVGALGPTLLAAVATLNSRIMRIIGVRYTGMLGVSLIGLAQILAGFAVKSVPGRFITNGVVLGLGFGEFKLVDMALLIVVIVLLRQFQVTSSTPAQYFSKKRGLANGVVFAGGGLGGAVLSLALDPLIRKAGPAWAFRVLGLGTLATGLPAAWFLKERTAVRRGGFVECLAAVSMLAVWPVSTTLAPLAVFSVVNGMANGGFFSTMPTVVGNCFGSARVTVAMGMIVTSWSGGYLLGAPIAGYLLEAYGGQDAGFQAYRPAMFYAGSLALGASGLVAASRLRLGRRVFARI
ncbi:hypothetical protein CHU98_g3652 [Xylaria longipes]|nr:hypothetical protein CHU98_g3652 [Xylaria longipes]